MTSTTNSTALDPAVQQSVDAWNAMNVQYANDLNDMSKDAKNCTTAADILNLFIDFMNIYGDQISLQSDAQDTSNALLNQVSGIGTTIDNMENDAGTDQCTTDAQTLIDQMNALNACLNDPTVASMFDPDSLSTLQQAANGITSTFGDDWGNPSAMANDMNDWITQSTTVSTDSDGNQTGGTYCPQLKSLTDNLNQMNQTISGIQQVVAMNIQNATNMENTVTETGNDWMQAWLTIDSSTLQIPS